MSMSQEEIEALMSGAGDLEEDTAADEIETNIDSEEEISLEDVIEDDEDTTIDNDNMDDILAGIDGIVDDEVEEDISTANNTPAPDNNIESMIEQSQYPLPAKAENKVVNQLNEVAEDSEEKASQIFDVLSFILDENNEIDNYNKKMGEFIESQVKLLDSLSVKFPNINVFNEHLEQAKELVESSKDLSAKVNAENNKVFEAMELMQFHDINRQKIERVMAVIKKLNSYLNGIFEDESDKPEVQIAQHISGDSNDTVDAADLESLISEFAN